MQSYEFGELGLTLNSSLLDDLYPDAPFTALKNHLLIL